MNIDRRPQNLAAVIRRRRMIRAFGATPLHPELVDQLLDTARRAPSAGNSQATTFVVLDSTSLTERYWQTTLSAAARQGFRWQGLLRAPVLVLIMTDPGRYTRRYQEPDKASAGRTTIEAWPVPYWWVDAGTVAQNLLLLATEQGLGACLFGPFDHEQAIKDEFDLPSEQRVVATIALGHPLSDEPGRSFNRKRRPLDEIIFRPNER